MDSQRFLSREALTAQIACVEALTAVRSQVHGKGIRSGELFPTLSTIIWFLLTVNPLMNNQVSTLGKTFIANVACEWFFTSMNSFVLLQVALLREPFVAVTAREWLFAIVRINVNVQRALFHVVLVAVGIWTSEKFPLGMMFHVLRQRGGPFEPFAAHRTEVWFSDHIPQFAGVLAVMFSQIRTFSE